MCWTCHSSFIFARFSIISSFHKVYSFHQCYLCVRDQGWNYGRYRSDYPKVLNLYPPVVWRGHGYVASSEIHMFFYLVKDVNHRRSYVFDMLYTILTRLILPRAALPVPSNSWNTLKPRLPGQSIISTSTELALNKITGAYTVLESDVGYSRENPTVNCQMFQPYSTPNEIMVWKRCSIMSNI